MQYDLAFDSSATLRDNDRDEDVTLVGDSQCGHLAKRYEQYMTPEHIAQRIVEAQFPDLTSRDIVLDPGCGRGAFLKAVPGEVQAYGIEIDAALAAYAEKNTGRAVITGDFRLVDLPVRPTVAIGNPPFSLGVAQGFIDRLYDLLPEGGRAGLILPSYHLQNSDRVCEWAKKWSLRQDAIPRDIFPGLSLPLNWVVLTKEKVRRMFGFFLYEEQSSVRRLHDRAKLVLVHGKPGVGAWSALFDAALEANGGTAALEDIYRFCEGRRPSENPYWKEQLRKVSQSDRYVRIDRATYKRANALAA